MKLKSIELKNFKNISDLKIEFKSNNLSGIYGLNRTGKISIVESLQILQRYFRIEKEPLEEKELIRQIKKVMKIGEDVLSIQIELEGEKYRYQFSVSFERDVFDKFVL
ncbi:AAA family ATPase [Leptotrichia sp. oral taxon 223]|uniref:AAA family ATPase n=1 Tax=Leptotrichia sp. oral taxon 223 TaxID=712363 RepID=UPI0015B851B0|nr:AAA family ATPase [Leptotrichia sp. oral taxon 223]NWO19334.1 AAA family ATPase [Leptotrichia sp. oral taxon 223]